MAFRAAFTASIFVCIDLSFSATFPARIHPTLDGDLPPAVMDFLRSGNFKKF
jgi:hypothetical protein